MSTLTSLTYHIVFSTKCRRRIITESIQDRLYQYIGGIIRGQDGCLVEIGGIEDHVHLLTNLSPTLSVSNAVRDIKANSSKWINELPNAIQSFHWQKGYGAFTVSQSQIHRVRSYIRNQHEHHRQRTFQEEFLEILQRHNIQYDPQYVFESEHHG